MAIIRNVLYKNNPPPITPAMQAEIDYLKNMSDNEIDLSDAPEELDWSNATRGSFFNKNIHRIKIDDDVAEWLDKKGFAEHFNRFINQLLRQTMQKEQLS